MPTVRQKKIAKLIIENATIDKPLNGGKMLEKVSYSKGLQKQPSRILESAGVKQALADYGFTEDNAKKVVASILLDEDKQANDRLKAADMTFKVHGSYPKDNQTPNQTVIIVMPNELIKKNEPNTITVSNS